MPAYIKIPDVTGEVNEQNHQQWVEVNSVSLPIHRSIQNGAVGVGRSNGETTLGDVVVSKTWDSSTPGLAAAVANGKFKDEVVPLKVRTMDNGKWKEFVFDTDEGPRADASLEKMKTLKPAFKPDGIATAGRDHK